MHVELSPKGQMHCLYIRSLPGNRRDLLLREAAAHVGSRDERLSPPFRLG